MPHGYAAANSGTEGTALAHTLAGEPVTGVVRANAAGENIALATQFSTAPYIPPEKRHKAAKRCIAKDGTCKGSRMKDSEYCVGHARSLGLLDKTWTNKGEVTYFDEAGD